MIILDTNVLSEAMKAVPAAEVLAWLAAQTAASLYTTSITQADPTSDLALRRSDRGDCAFRRSGDSHPQPG